MDLLKIAVILPVASLVYAIKPPQDYWSSYVPTSAIAIDYALANLHSIPDKVDRRNASVVANILRVEHDQPRGYHPVCVSMTSNVQKYMRTCNAHFYKNNDGLYTFVV